MHLRRPRHGRPTNGAPDWWSYSRYSQTYIKRVYTGEGTGYADSRPGYDEAIARDREREARGDGNARQAAPGTRAGNQPSPYAGAAQPTGGGAPQAGAHARRRPHLPRRGHRRLRHPVRDALVAIVVALVGIYLAVFLPVDRAIAFPEATAQALSSELGFHVPLTPTYALLLGSDAREGDTVSRTDTMILARIDGITNKVTLVSIPRDTMVELGENGTQKINAAYAFGGAALSVQAVEQLTGVSANEVAVIDFDGLASLIDAIGGVTVTVPVDVNDPDYTGLVLPAGTYDMDGVTALAFSRVRHGFANGDYQRQADQRIVIEAIITKLRTHPTKLAAAAKSLSGTLSTTYRCYEVIPLLLRMSIGSPTIYAASVPSTTQTVGGVSYVVANTDELAQMMQVVRSGGDPTTVANGLE